MMTELRRSVRVRQSARGGTETYNDFIVEEASVLAFKDIRAREWQKVEVQLGTFKVKKWVPKSQQHLTAELHEHKADTGHRPKKSKRLKGRIPPSKRGLRSRHSLGGSGLGDRDATATPVLGEGEDGTDSMLQGEAGDSQGLDGAP
eukprot:TRINITY_DN12551_c0_g1_i1.p2 TRINITY_DN12551_c0_g1~~TRINITY_DN12551_c0_g1_i1.p2  ORF type:complete len:146 (+),score=22.30 TRINITY_DN12551_c0_g1_i1:179-616(+)